MSSVRESNFQRIGRKIAQKRIEKKSDACKNPFNTFSNDIKMNHDKKAEKGKKILYDKILSRV
ncbi:hypothetical protein [Acetivibrio clariflavus]|uniref:Uncharacterized protein n=1 Tax=Acetivibrio clariflavus (strain DSM 19732 / NBRC 101661 / EBR45) TaxID=720554 RepID=G8LSI1_ACECE|nr:hypothetical protein [Acetivibrio clariflavus]AEV68285.1 hypothetical protein Clocl_1662 [Acetivibrio clariflavus DSM 19732]HOQ00786.1 hypothetical protein [Acetivibrio clariflavus]